jgi:hypothetical protein
MTHPIDRPAISLEEVDLALEAAGRTLPDHDPEGLGRDRPGVRADWEGIRSIYFESQAARPIKERGQETQRTIEMAKALRRRLSVPFDAPLNHWPARELRDFSFVRTLDAFIAERERDLSPPAVLNVYSASAFENAVAMLADRWQYYFEEKPGYSTTTIKMLAGGVVDSGGEVYGDFIAFAESALAAMNIHNADGGPYPAASIARALRKLEGKNRR